MTEPSSSRAIFPSASRAILALACVLVVAAPAAAQGPVVVWMAGEPEAAGRAELWARRVERALERDGAEVTAEDERWSYEARGFARERIEEIDSIELLLFLARSRASDLDERGALSALVEAERRAEAVLSLPGGVRWYAEVEVQLAIAAFQLGEVSLARAALARAATLDPGRTVQPAEGPPELVALATEVARVARAAGRSSFEVRVPSLDAGTAQVFVDDEFVGSAPVRVETTAGTHALRVEAPGHHPWASVPRFVAGTRAPLEVTLSPRRPLELARALRTSVRAMDLPRIPGLLASLSSDGVPIELVLVEVGQGAFDRAALVRCDTTSCVVARLLEGDAPARRTDLVGEAVATIDEARAWLAELPDLEGPAEVPRPVWEEPWLWATLGVVVVGAAAGITAGVVVDGAQTPSGATIVLPPF